jgi:hypothetical protein
VQFIRRAGIECLIDGTDLKHELVRACGFSPVSVTQER